jgi:hypothetical protein
MSLLGHCQYRDCKVPVHHVLDVRKGPKLFLCCKHFQQIVDEVFARLGGFQGEVRQLQ